MKLSTRGRYATMALVDMAQQFDAGRREAIRLGEIAERQEIPLAYLEQIFARLRRAGLVVSRRGAQGGYVLAQPPAEISIADVIIASEEGWRMTRCTKGEAGCLSGSSRCLTHHLWAALGQQIREFCRHISLADVLRDVSALPLAASAPRATAPRGAVSRKRPLRTQTTRARSLSAQATRARLSRPHIARGRLSRPHVE